MNNTGVKTVALLALFLLFLPVVSLAQGGYEYKYNISVANMEKGFPSNYVDDLFVDSAGFIWIATGGGGLCRFDGTELLTFSYATTPSVRSNFVRNVVQDGFNRLCGDAGGKVTKNPEAFWPRDFFKLCAARLLPLWEGRPCSFGSRCQSPRYLPGWGQSLYRCCPGRPLFPGSPGG